MIIGCGTVQFSVAMTLSEKIQADLAAAMKARDELRTSVLRMVKAALKNREVEKMRPLDDAESVQLLQSLVKQRRESVEQFTKGNRPELAEKESSEIAIIESYLPAAPSAGPTSDRWWPPCTAIASGSAWGCSAIRR